MLSVASAFAHVLATARLLPSETVPLPAAAGRILAAPLAADRDLPPFDRVMMDGLALAHAAWADGQTSFAVERTQYAGEPPQTLQNPLAAIEIMTGAVLPPGTDTVVRYEDLTLADGRATLHIPPPPQSGANVHVRGSDRRQGAVLLQAGIRLGPAEIAVAATVGAAEIAVIRTPRVAVVSTGDELVPITAVPLPHQIRRSNAYALQALLTQAGAEVALFHLPDAKAALRTGLVEILAGGYDAVVLSGAVSQGRADHVPGLLRELGAAEIFHGVAQRPGKPLWFGQLPGGPVVFGLPGNPVSTLLTAYRYVRPWLRAAQGGPPVTPTQALLTERVQFAPSITYFLPVRLAVDAAGRQQTTPLAPNGSGDLAGLVGADGFLELPAEPAVFAAGEVWPVWQV